MKIVMKFGGSSLASSSRIVKAAQIVARSSKNNTIIVVASATGTTTDQLDELGLAMIKSDKSRSTRILSTIERTHLNLAKGITKTSNLSKESDRKISALNSELDKTVEGLSHLKELTARSRDYLLSFGERFSVVLLAAAIIEEGSKAKAYTGAEAGIVTDDTYGEAKPLVQLSYQQLRRTLEPRLDRKEIPVVTGFIASTSNGIITTLGRGGSDYTASLIAAALHADEIWIWTDVDGLMTADPRIVENARVLTNVSYGEALELSYFGAKMMHPRALQPAAQAKIPVKIKNSIRPEGEGTLISNTGPSKAHSKVVRAVSIIPSVGIVTVSGAGMIGAPGTAAKIFQVLGSNRINVMMISQGSSEATISIVVARKDVDSAVRALQLALVRPGEGQVDKITVEKDACIIAVVGSGMKGTPGVAARIFGAVGKEDVNVRMVAQGSSEYNVSLVVSEQDGPNAVRAIHNEFQLSL